MKKTINLPEILIHQQHKSCQQFNEQYPKAVVCLSAQQLADFESSLMVSDFILNSALQCPETVVSLFFTGRVYQVECPNYQTMLAELLAGCESEAQLHKILRQFRLQEMVNIAVADLLFELELTVSLERLSELADQLILAALNWLTLFCRDKWGTPTSKNGETQQLLVYGMGKLGGRELNFSSDIDLIFTYPEMGETQGARRSLDNQQFFTRLAQKLIAALHQKTADGFVYRVDMRLRPYGESGPLVLTFNAMEDYYQEQGRDWERYAMLKARLIGQGKYHDQLSTMLRPFVYRRYIDFSVIDSLRRMKMMIAQEVRRKQLKNNIKLGAGGIREVEFIVQVFQLVRGGRVKELQHRRLLTVLPILVEKEVISAENEVVLTTAYCFLRRVENIIQALNDQQTQTLPDNELDQMRLLWALNHKCCETWPEFLNFLAQQMNGVHQEFCALIGEDSPNHQAKDQHWTTLWDSDWSDEEGTAWVAQVSVFVDANKIWQLLVEFKTGMKNRSIGNRGRAVLDKLVPVLMWHIQQEHSDHTTLERVLIIFSKISTRTAYIELLFENEGALKHLIKLCYRSSWVAEHIAKYPILLDELIDPTLLNNPPELSSYAVDLRQVMLRIPEDDQEAQMDRLRQFKQAQHLRIAAADICEILPVTKVSDHLTALAEAIINEVIHLAWQQMSERFGVPESTVGQDHKGFAAIAYGKMGGIELGYSSDLDLVFVHNSQSDEVTTGTKQVPALQFYMKLAQRIMHIFNTRMASGILYELDMRLRPSGNSGLLVVHIDSFEKYQHEEAWTWEHQALVRTRMVYGHQALASKFIAIRKAIISKPRERSQVRADVLAMREKMRLHLDKSTMDNVDIKQGQGGLVDIEFLVQFLVLSESARHNELCQYSDNIRLLKQLKHCRVINEEQQKQLAQCYCNLRDFGHHATLKNEQQLLSNVDFAGLAAKVKAICQTIYQ
ncbi:MAG: bifunctional [glutamate--ammonia ligase]-adenylyl-L-tyrosine phosphorylase/[glutamate--ammonia-ligase] adenylyltransferase [Colwellia sp.]|nr:bifunctional [glutamate--ammonia ligase]-adenylyl-L-tyrosine phosphorylase/[glutamate--ammonia-ligase] adenylyltransferase [Colwellia sp.]